MSGPTCFPGSPSRGLKLRNGPGDTALEEITIGIYKPDAFEKEGVSKEIADMIKGAGLDIVNAKHILISPGDTRAATALTEVFLAHYNKDDDWCIKVGARIIQSKRKAGQAVDKTAMEYGREVLQSTIDYMMSGRIRVVAFSGKDAVKKLRDLTGATEPASAAPGTIRRTFGSDSYELAAAENRTLRNLFHCSDSIEEAKREHELWFGKNSNWF